LYEDVAGAMAESADSSISRFWRRLAAYGALDQTEIAAPDNLPHAAIPALRGVTGVNRRVGDVRRLVGARIDKTAADMVVPFEVFADVMVMYREGYESRGVDYAIWGHVSDGNVHPNVIPRSYADVVRGREAILEFGREVVRLGGSPLAEHGVGRSTIKQTLLRQLYGERGIEQMRAIKREIDPDWKLAPGVIFQR
jgi:D-lactate dehydrogenase (cytochrome)